MRVALEQLERLAQQHSSESVKLSAQATSLLIVEAKLLVHQALAYSKKYKSLHGGLAHRLRICSMALVPQRKSLAAKQTVPHNSIGSYLV